MACEEIICRTIDIKTERTQAQLKQVDGTMKEVGKSTKELDKSLGALPGPLGKVQQGIAGVGKAFKALLANPIVAILAAIVLALTALFKAFTKTQEGADKMNDVMKAVSAALDVITQRAAKLFKALGQIFRGNFKEGFQEMGDAVKGVGDEIRVATAAAIEFEKAQRALFLAETDVITANAERRQQIAELVFVTRDLTKSVEERRQAIIDADAIEKEILADNIKLQEQRVALAQAAIENSAEEIPTREELRLLAEAEAALINLQTESLGKQRELKNRLNEIDNQAAAARKAEHQLYLTELEEKQAAEEEFADFLKGQQDDLRRDEMDLDEMFRQEDIKAEEQAAKDKEAISQAEAEALINITKDRYKAEEDQLAEQLKNEELAKSVREGIYQNSLNALIGFLGEGSKAARAIQIADATKSAIQGAITTYSSVAAIPVVGPVLAVVAAAAALAAGMANVRKIAQQTAPGVPGGGASVPSVSLAAPQTDVVSEDLTQTDVSIPDEVAISQGGVTRGAMKTYVVQSDVTAAQDIERQREADVTL